jgi:hypothetical protein
MYKLQANLLITSLLNPMWTRVIIVPENKPKSIDQKTCILLQREEHIKQRPGSSSQAPTMNLIQSTIAAHSRMPSACSDSQLREPEGATPQQGQRTSSIVDLFCIQYTNLIHSIRSEGRVIVTSRNSQGTTIGDYTFEFDSVLDAKCFHEIVSQNIIQLNKSTSYG